MKLLLLSGCIIVALVLGAYAQNAPAKSIKIIPTPVKRVFNPAFKGKPEEEIESLEHRLSDAVRTSDVGALEQLLAGRVLIAGVIADKGQFIALLNKVHPNYSSLEKSEMRIQLYGDTAVTTGIQKANVLRENGESMSQTIFLNTWKRIDGNWQCIGIAN